MVVMSLQTSLIALKLIKVAALLLRFTVHSRDSDWLKASQMLYKKVLYSEWQKEDWSLIQDYGWYNEHISRTVLQVSAELSVLTRTALRTDLLQQRMTLD